MAGRVGLVIVRGDVRLGCSREEVGKEDRAADGQRAQDREKEVFIQMTFHTQGTDRETSGGVRKALIQIS